MRALEIVDKLIEEKVIKEEKAYHILGSSQLNTILEFSDADRLVFCDEKRTFKTTEEEKDDDEIKDFLAEMNNCLSFEELIRDMNDAYEFFILKKLEGYLKRKGLKLSDYTKIEPNNYCELDENGKMILPF